MYQQIILASGSPRRRQLLEQAGISHKVIVSNADETVDGLPDEQVKELAIRKAHAVIPMLEPDTDAIIIAADTIVFINGEVLGKPENRDHAFEMLKKLSGNTHEVYTGVAIVRHPYNSWDGAHIAPPITDMYVFADKTEVTFRHLSDREIFDYIATGEPFDKAGAYGIQERGSVLVDRINGDFYTVMGLPISKVYTALEQFR